MVNPGVIGLILILVIITVGVIGVVIWAGFQEGIIGSTLGQCSTTIDPNSLIPIDPDSQYCSVPSQTQGVLYYIGCAGNKNLNFVVSRVAQNPQDVCVSYCDTFSNGICTGNSYNGQSAQQNYDTCIAALTPTNCVGPLPLASDGTDLYYAYSATCNVCDACVCECYTCTACGSSVPCNASTCAAVVATCNASTN